MKIVVDDLSGPGVARLLAAHLEQMRAASPPESKHALDLEALRRPEITCWSVIMESGEAVEEVVGCGALKRLDETHAELKSMSTSSAHRGAGIATALLTHILDAARAAGYRRISLETGSAEFFAPARRLYERFGFSSCDPFADYESDPHSVFLTRSVF